MKKPTRTATDLAAAAGERSTKGTPRGLDPFQDFCDASEALSRAIAGDPFYGILCGASGSGKSFLLRHEASRFDRHRVQVVWLPINQPGTPLSEIVGHDTPSMAR